MFFKEMLWNLLVLCVLFSSPWFVCGERQEHWQVSSSQYLNCDHFLFTTSSILSSSVYGIYWSFLLSWFDFPNWNCSMWFTFFTWAANVALVANPARSFDNSFANSSSEECVSFFGGNTVQNVRGQGLYKAVPLCYPKAKICMVINSV